ncbi:sphingosine kinase 2 [Tribolium castaneum]|uniref:Sphingosine kinase 2-like Protein n=1 Tax=Tribolium castaneum TaxID=7070 RepID=D6WDP5_TRICA|nr:PREDICTED: sphingosine kinase 2 [Tribolium castaneum]EFA00810.1 Sphingosine kinase 2-like Protein [Tribolium castaneum]|eukprot:XP_970111.2 PREDICTED: sphingosine kinase 2 [Tribolium castaneum]
METKSEESAQNRVLLEETFYVLTKKNCVFRVRLTKAGLCLVKESENNIKEQVIPIQDIIGCRCLRSKKQSKNCACQSIPRSANLKVVEENSGDLDDTDVSAYLYIYAYILVNNKGTSKKRERTIITLRFRSFDKYEDNNKEAQRWRTMIKRLIKGENVSTSHIADFSVSNKYKEDRRLLVLCNPKSGPGKGRIIFQQKVVPILQEAEIPYDLHITKYANFAREFIRTCNIFQWSGIILVGGDGIVFEAINGLFERWDWSDVVKTIPIGVIPGGSGNGLARSIAYHCSEPYLPSPTLPSALAAVRNNCAPMDLVRVETTSQIMFSFLSVGWGFLSDIDIESERLRMLGGQRFTVWSVARLIGLRSYGGKLWYLPANVPLVPTRLEVNTGSALDLPAEVHLETQTGRQRLDSWYSAASRRSAYFSATGSSYQSTADSGGGGDPFGGDPDKPRMYGPASKLPCLTQPLDKETWKCIEGRFVMVHASYQTHLGEDCLFAPDAKLNDGTIWLLIVHGGTTRTQLLHFLLGLSTGAHTSMVGEGGPIELIAVNAFRIEPDMNEQGYMTVDGEHVEYGPIQAEVFPSLARVMVP